jgi:hypothetical protein
VAQLAGVGVMMVRRRLDGLELGAELTAGTVLPLIADTDEFVATNEKDFFGHLATSYCRKYYHNI